MTLEATVAGSMRAIVQNGYGPDVLRLAEMARPEIADSEVLLRQAMRQLAGGQARGKIAITV